MPGATPERAEPMNGDWRATVTLPSNCGTTLTVQTPPSALTVTEPPDRIWMLAVCVGTEPPVAVRRHVPEAVTVAAPPRNVQPPNLGWKSNDAAPVAVPENDTIVQDAVGPEAPPNWNLWD